MSTVSVRTAEATAVLEWQIRDIEDKLPELLERLKELAWKRVSNWLE